MKIIPVKNKVILRIEERFGEGIEEILRRRFVDENQPIQTIADELNLSFPSIIKYLRLAGIYSRRLSSLNG